MWQKEGLNTSKRDSIQKIIENFSISGTLLSYKANGTGNVNDTFRVDVTSDNCTTPYTLQRINHNVFKDPESLMTNYSRVTRHLQSKGNNTCLTLIASNRGDSFFRDDEGNFWRMMPYIEGVQCYNLPEKSSHAYEAGKAFGQFQLDLCDLPGDPLFETIPNFHNTPNRFKEYLDACEADSSKRFQEVFELDRFISLRKSLCTEIDAEVLPRRIVHNDTKLNNVLLDEKTGEGVSVIDLDTVMPGCVLHDFGDLVRTTCCSVDENERDVSKVSFLLPFFESITKGYLDATCTMLEQDEVSGLASAPLVITYELGLRFLTDFLCGDKYFKTSHPSQNLERAKVQFKLLESMEQHRELMNEVVLREWQLRMPTESSFCT